MDLIIVESPSKAKTISKYLDGKYRVDASGGHVMDLPEKRMGVDLKSGNFTPEYVVTKGKEDVIKRLKGEAAKAGKVYLATDPDREGEAISYHLQNALGLNPEDRNRIEFNEISPKAVKNALEHPRKVNPDLVNAQQARRVLDRIVGYKLSPLLNRRIQTGLSAGRVQSVALRLIVDREREIQAFKPDAYWTYTATLCDDKKASFAATYQLKKKKGSVEDGEAQKVEDDLKAGEFVVKKVKKGVTEQHAPAPFTTSSLQQDASNKLGLTSPETMVVAQHLYEGMEIGGDHIAFISYIRTDSVRISSDAQSMARDFILKNFGEEYYPKNPNVYATKKQAQDAHEAIRPIDMDMTPQRAKSLLDKKHYNVYKLIYDRFLASQMEKARYDAVSADIDNSGYTFKASGRVMIFPGYTAAYSDVKAESSDDDEDVSAKLLPPLAEGQKLTCLDLKKDKKFTRPPQRYTDASLVKTMEDLGIGRPSTYSSIISVLTKRGYVKKEGKSMVPSDVAFKMTDFLVDHFDDVMDVNFTARMEEDLDKIEEGDVAWNKVIGDFYPGFSERLDKASTDGDEITDILCEKCGSPMIRKTGRYGKYLACSNYPNCKNIKSETPPEVSDKVCPNCGANLVVKSGRYGKFLACPNYPSCKYILSMDATLSEEKCPTCGGDMYLKHGRYGDYLECASCKFRKPVAKKNENGETPYEGICPECGKPTRRMHSAKKGKIYYGCTGYPECKFLSWDIPTGKKCPKCGAYLVEKKDLIRCSSKTCDYSEKNPRKTEEK